MVAAAVDKAVSLKQPFDFEARIVTPNKNVVWVRASGKIVEKMGMPIGIRGSIQDITHRKQTEIELIKAKDKAEENQKLYEGLIQSSHNLIWKCDLEGKFTFLNAAWESTHGYTVDEMLGRPFSDFQRPEVFERDVIEFTKHLAGGFVKGYETTHIIKDGSEIPLIFNALPLFNSKGEIIGTQGTAFDISKLKETEIELIEAKDKAEESDRLKSAFLANMSHEIRTPMNGILGFTDLLKEPDLSGEQKEKYIEIIRKSGDRMLDTVNDIIDISKIDSKQVEISKVDINIHNVFENQYEFFRVEAAIKGLELRLINKLPQKSIMVSDKVKLDSIISNLVKNAIKYTDDGSIKMHCCIKKSELEVKISDTGIGISDERIGGIFNRFEQADIEDSHAREGSGLGLAITKAYVELLGGKVGVVSKLGKGSEFWFTLPWIEKQEKPHDSGQDESTKVADKKQLNILIAEDDDISYEHLNIILTPAANRINRVTNGKDALDYIKENTDTHFVFMDVKMPVLNGYLATEEIRKFNKDVIVVAQTAYALEGEKEKALSAGCNDYLAKPINKEALFNLLYKHVKK